VSEASSAVADAAVEEASTEHVSVENSAENIDSVENAAAEQPSAEKTEKTKTADEPPKPWEPVVRRWWRPVTVLTVALEIAVGLRLGVHWSTLPVALFASTAVVLSLIDFAVLRLPNIFTEPTALAVCAALAVQALAEHRPHHMLSELYGGLAMGLFYQLLRLVGRGGLGVGDVKVGAVAGALLAARGLQPVFDGLLVAWLATVVVAIVMMTRRKKQFPYGPGILLGALFVLLV
jgi:leader peptidase (prepilin peptidase)/N-methyltransferase